MRKEETGNQRRVRTYAENRGDRDWNKNTKVVENRLGHGQMPPLVTSLQ